jgi:large subunit ribosomal protein L29
MKIKELSKLSKIDLKKQMNDAREKLRQIRFELASGKVKDVREIREIKKDIARMMTLLNN